ncbi:phospholipase D/Transphosphatidylase [Nitrosococcus halophilus Nc 4]|uniref:Phospholipase D/Transphosphatidylase n=2 Tax=Nitrosococcus halophilus TaxID=133539 RepID=D5C2Y7_NITHN|nr:phospholipase D/Transphosphatidylase [Nitrosococcus halophilus Nc 4]
MLSAMSTRISIIALCLLAFCMGLIWEYSALPSLESRSPSSALFDTARTRLGRAISPRVDAHPGKSGIYPLPNAHDAFAARALLAQAAERTLDVQYYIWRKDMTGTLLFEALHAAANRGVRVRLLLDDNNTSGLDTMLAALDSHPHIEVRLFNPFVIRKPRLLGYLTDFSRLNRRMHNKSFTADNQATIIGGRNIGDEYFGATEGVLFVDLDVMAVGPVVTEVSKDFDRYWASASSYPIARLLPPADPAMLAEIAAAAPLIEQDPAAAAYTSTLRHSSFVRDLIEGKLPLEWAAVRMISDDPAKGLGLAAPDTLLPYKLEKIIGKPKTDMELVSAYFVPTAAGVDWFTALTGRDVRVKVLTNSFEATDVAIVHAGYAKRRRALLKAGITLYELRRLSPERGASKSAGPIGSSASSLHAKTFSVDQHCVFIGSFNFDPRSAKLNTELGFVIDSPVLAQQIKAALDSSVPASAYEVHLSDTGQLYWIEHQKRKRVRHNTEPGTSFWQRAGIRFLSWLPIEWLL